MPLSSDTHILETSKGLVDTLRGGTGGASQSFRPAHAKGQLLTGTFTPTPEAAALTSAHHFNATSTPITLRFSSSTGLPSIPDTNASANPRGIAVRFHLPEVDGRRQHTDVIAHSTKYFPTRTGAEFLEFLRAAGGPDASSAVPEFLGRHPETARFLQDPKPSPVSFGTEVFYGVNAYYLEAQEKKTAIRYRFLPVAGRQVLSEEELKGKSATYLFDELAQHIKAEPIVFNLVAQVAEEGDVVDNATVLWPEERKIVTLGEIRVDKALSDEDSLTQQKEVIFDPVPRVAGLSASDDPLLDIRANVYLISGKQRREAPVEKASA